MTLQVSDVRAALTARLGPAGYEHSVAVADTAGRIARAYSVDPDEAYLAGLLHDWARDEGDAALLEEAAKRNIEITAVDEAVPYLLHAPVGAALIRERYPELPERITDAVARHTFGSPQMSELDCVVYLADALEPGRDTPAANDLRHEVGRVALEELYARAYAASLEHLVRGRRHLHPRTVEAWNAIVGEQE